jgi:5-methylcytosine-specific restriction endonuclease McrA
MLNAHYMALRIVSVRRALTLLFKTDLHENPLAEIIHVEDGKYVSYNFEDWRELSELRKKFEPDSHDWIHTVRFDLAVPRIIRVLGYNRLPKQEVKFNRRNIYARDGSRCQYCGHRFPTTELSLDHVMPRSQGGPTTWENLVSCCLRCNVKKGGRTPEQAHLKLIAKPVKPARSPVVSIALSQGKYHSWKQFLDHAYWTVELQ